MHRSPSIKSLVTRSLIFDDRRYHTYIRTFVGRFVGWHFAVHPFLDPIDSNEPRAGIQYFYGQFFRYTKYAYPCRPIFAYQQNLPAVPIVNFFFRIDLSWRSNPRWYLSEKYLCYYQTAFLRYSFLSIAISAIQSLILKHWQEILIARGLLVSVHSV